MIQDKTLNEIQHESLAALKDRLGVAGMVRFLQQFEHGSGDFASQRHEWVDRTPMDEIRTMAGLKNDAPAANG